MQNDLNNLGAPLENTNSLFSGLIATIYIQSAHSGENVEQ